MTRNLDRRVECLVRIEDERLRARLARIIGIYFADNQMARMLQSDGSYRRLKPAVNEQARSSQELLLAESVAQTPAAEDRPTRRFRVKKHR